ncbi:MAG: HlyD family secretion protein [Halioglobus sp.]|jgi:HlyD family secretion protein
MVIKIRYHDGGNSNRYKTGAYFFKYPDKLTGQGILTSATPPIEIISRSTGYIEDIHYNEGGQISKGGAILYINSTTDQGQLSELEAWIQKYESINDPSKTLNLSFVDDLQLGAVQGEYAGLQLKYNELHQTLKEGVVFQQIDNISRGIAKVKTLNQSQERAKVIYAKELALRNKDYARNERLKNDGAVSELDLERAKTVLLQKERQYEGMNNTIISNTIRIEQLELEKLKLQEQRSNTIKQYTFSISETIARIRSSIKNWNNTYIIEAPIDSVLTLGKDITLKRNLKRGQLIGYVMSEHSEQQYISALYPSNNIGKVEIGQKAILKFDAYSHKEYGVILSQVGEISKVPEMDEKGEPMYELKTPIDNQLITDYGKK